MLSRISDFVIHEPIGFSLSIIFVWMTLVSLTCGFYLARKTTWKEEIRAASILIAVLSLMFFAFEQRAQQVNEASEETIDRIIENVETAIQEIAEYSNTPCRALDLTLLELRQENFLQAKSDAAYCRELRISIRLLETVVPQALRDPTYTFPSFHEVKVSDNLRSAETDNFLDEKYRSFHGDLDELRILLVANDTGNWVKSWFVVFVLLFATGAAIDIGSELRDWFPSRESNEHDD